MWASIEHNEGGARPAAGENMSASCRRDGVHSGPERLGGESLDGMNKGKDVGLYLRTVRSDILDLNSCP